MKKTCIPVASALFSLLLLQCAAQPGTNISSVEEAFKSGATVSEVLTNEKFLALHPDQDFRDLVKNKADSAAVDISPAGEPGKRIRIIVTATDAGDKPLKNCLVYFYQTDAKGWYSADRPHVGGNSGDMRQARLFGYARTNSYGQLEIHTVKPSGYPESDLPAHIHIHFERAGRREHVTELLFDDDERLVGNVRDQSIRYGFHVARPLPAPEGFDQEFQYQIQVP